jgi:steroid delta-isomerase-like uncharacterized protein
VSTKDNKAIVRRFVDEVWSKGNMAVADEVVAANVVDHNPIPGQAAGVEGIKQVVATFRRAFPDAQFRSEDMIAEGDKVVTRWTGRGTHKGEFADIPATGRAIVMTGIDIFRVANGKIVERWANQDDLGMMKQLGVIPLARELGA